MADAKVAIFVDYGSELARSVAEGVWSGLSRAALDSGSAKIATFWERLDSKDVISLALSQSPSAARSQEIAIFVVGQERPDIIDEIEAPPGDSKVFGLVVAVPDIPSPLAGPLLYQGVERLKSKGVRAARVEPALLRGTPDECESYARKLLERLPAEE
ncbi:MAG: hypothetical protein M3494_17805 [Actinomycetota bacterium]|nr:hypothetical protein [Rubrobacter sp.]MDQ3509832.1 hypothetical protein [Actinomycetota bacterium]